MKYNKIYFAFLIAALALLGACSQYEDTVVPGPSVPAGNPAVRFAQSNPIKIELDPSNLSFQVNVMRDNPAAALSVPVTVLADTAHVFNVPATLSFAAGASTATLQINVNSSAPTGVPINVQVTFDNQYINPYKADGYPIYSTNITIVKWNNLGTVQFYDSFSFYHVAQVTLEQRDDVKTMYRINSPYQEDILLDAEWTGWIGGTTQDKIVFTVKGTNVTWDKFWYTNLLYNGNTGQEIKAYLPSVIGKTGDTQSIVVKDNSGNIQYFKLYPSFYVDGVGGWGLKVVYVGFPGFDLAGALGLGVFGQ